MRIEYVKDGWKEITTQFIYVTDLRESKNPYIEKISEYIKVNKRAGVYSRYRRSCNCCHKIWDTLKGSINNIMTNKGSLVVCDSCYEKIKKESSEDV